MSWFFFCKYGIDSWFFFQGKKSIYAWWYWNITWSAFLCRFHFSSQDTLIIHQSNTGKLFIERSNSYLNHLYSCQSNFGRPPTISCARYCLATNTWTKFWSPVGWHKCYHLMYRILLNVELSKMFQIEKKKIITLSALLTRISRFYFHSGYKWNIIKTL